MLEIGAAVVFIDDSVVMLDPAFTFTPVLVVASMLPVVAFVSVVVVAFVFVVVLRLFTPVLVPELVVLEFVPVVGFVGV
jgi:hypothetical protein